MLGRQEAFGKPQAHGAGAVRPWRTVILGDEKMTAKPMDKEGIFVATCVCSAPGCVLMGLRSNVPVALAPSWEPAPSPAISSAPPGRGPDWLRSYCFRPSPIGPDESRHLVTNFKHPYA